MPLKYWQVTEVKTWLADEDALTHFESLELEMVCEMQWESDVTTIIVYKY